MSDAKAQQEPTMEEILASIRRIISEDDKPADGGEAADAAGEAEVEEEAVAEEEPAAEPESEDDDVLELTEVVSDDLEATPEPIDEFDAPEPDQDTDVDFDLPPEPEPSYEEPEPMAPSMAATEGYRGLVSDPTATHATSTFAQLAGARTAARGMPLGQHHKTLEDLTKELLRPMLKEWLDRHLPPLVERLVEREIAKLAGNADEK
jgi:cell pole-organizing protein PopZ